MYDLIGDIHGHAAALKHLLKKMDYEEIDGIWEHPTRRAIFIGDYIDRGPSVREALGIVYRMVKKGNAIALMGNHEYNALAYAHQLPDGSFLRAHNAKHEKQHSATLEQFKDYQKEWEHYLEWFYTLPLYLETEGFRAVHACWDHDHIRWLTERGVTSINDELLVASHEKDTKAFDVFNELLKGKEIPIPLQHAWYDKDGHARTENRIKWWTDARASYGEFLFDCPDAMKDLPVNPDLDLDKYPTNAKPVFVGHYWLTDHTPALQSSNVVCLDYSIAKGGSLVAYRWNDEEQLSNDNFVVVR